MFKCVPGNKILRINLQQQQLDQHGLLDSDNSSNEVEIDLFGKKVRISKLRLSLLAHYEVGVMENLENVLDNIVFYPITHPMLKVRCGYQMSFKEPVEYLPGFRYIPSFPRYAINLDGVIFDTIENSLVDKLETTTDGYVVAYIYNPIKNGNRHVRVHRLMALAWLPNTDFVNRPFVNHLDGIRSNNRLTNLEWCSLEENAQHALNTGLTSTQIGMKTRDMITGEIVHYKSVSELSYKLGMTNVSATNLLNKLEGYLYKRRYEIKQADDFSPWFYEFSENIPNEKTGIKAIYTITTVNKVTGEIKKFTNVRAFYLKYKLYSRCNCLDNAITYFKEKYPDFEVSYKRNSIVGPYRVIDIETKKTVILKSIIEVGNFIGKTRTEIQYDLSRKFTYIYSNKWIIVPGLDGFDFASYVNKPENFSNVLVVNKKLGTETVANSILDAYRLTNVNQKSIAKYLRTGGTIKGYEFRAVVQ